MVYIFLAHTAVAMATNMSKKRKFVADGVFYAELNEVSSSTEVTNYQLPLRRLNSP